MYAFAGPQRKGDIAQYLHELLPRVDLVEVDIVRGEEFDLLDGKAWDHIFGLVRVPDTVFLASPPCHTFSRARHRKPGPPPLRSKLYPRGFPWLNNRNAAEVQASNFLIDQCLHAAALAVTAGNQFLLEHPEDLGLAPDGLIPASIWSWPELLDLLVSTPTVCFALFQCHFGAHFAKPTRLLTNLRAFLQNPPKYASLPSFDASHRYTGPLPRQCPHGDSHGPLIGKDAQTHAWRTAPSAAYPPAMCRWLATAIADSAAPSLPAGGVDSSEAAEVPEPPAGVPGVDSSEAAEVPEPPAGVPIPNPLSVSSGDPSPSLPGPGVTLPPALASGLSPSTQPSGLPEPPAGVPIPNPLSVSSGDPSPSLPGPGVTLPPALASGLSPSTQPSGLDPLTQPFPPEPPGQNPLHPAEALATSLLGRSTAVTEADLLRVHALLPREAPSRGGDLGNPGFSFSCGCYGKGGLAGLHRNTLVYPLVTKLLTSHVLKRFPGKCFSAVSIFENVRTPVHKDSRNAHHDNLVLPLSGFTNGQIWLEDEKGSVPHDTPEGQKLGQLLDVASGPVTFPAWERYHATCAWTGRRVVLVAYTTSGLGRLSAEHRDFALSVGFLLPSEAPGNSETSEAPALQVRGDTPFRPEICGNRGLPLEVTWEHRSEPITDGFGLCSPTRWRPCDRGAHLGRGAKNLSHALHRLALDFLAEPVPKPKELCMSLLTGKLEGSPFSAKHLGELRSKWAGLVCPRADQATFLEKPQGQPFFLRALACTAEALEDPDWQILIEGTDCYATGVPVGFEEELPRVPQVFELKTKARKLDESDPEHDRKNYPSAAISAEELRAKFREEELVGRMQPTTLGALKSDYPESRIRIASMGAIVKPDGSVRPIHDGTHGVGVNNGIALTNHVSVPGPGEMAFAVRQSAVMCETPLAVSADVKAAHRLLLHRKSDWALLACRASSEDDVVWINKVGTFGISSTSYWWARLFGIIGRTVARCLLQHAFYQFVYVDDLHSDFFGHRKFHNFLVWLLLHEMIGTPFAYHKFRGGTVVAFIGYELDYGSRLLGMSEARGEWLLGWVREAKSSHWVVSVRKFREYLGRLGFVCRVVYWIKPHLAPLYAWAAAASKSMVAKLPDLVILTLLYLEKTLGALDFKVAATKEPSEPSPVLHTDAKCADGYVVLGGWDSRFEPHEAPWFSTRLDPSMAPYLFDSDGHSQWASSSAELLATLVGLRASKTL